MKVLIFGINSFTGKSLADYLRQHNLLVFGTSNNQEEINSQFILHCDITQKYDIERVLHQVEPDCIINLAGISFVKHDDPHQLYMVNAFAVELILQACMTLEKKPHKIILASSSNVYGNQLEKELSEDLSVKPESHYAMSKVVMETIASWYADKLNIIVTRPFNYTGPNQDKKFLIPKIVDHFKRKAKMIELGNINVYREFNDISFVCDIYYKFLIGDINSGAYNICTGKGYCIKDIIKIMERMMGCQIKILVNDAFLRDKELQVLVGSVKKLTSAIGQIHSDSVEKTLQQMMYDS